MIEAEELLLDMPQDVDLPSVEQTQRLIDLSVEQIEIAFYMAGRDFNQAIIQQPMLAKVAVVVIREMVAGSIIAGRRKGVASVTSTTGNVSDSITYSSDKRSSLLGWITPMLTADQKAMLGLRGNTPIGRFPKRPMVWPERKARSWSW